MTEIEVKNSVENYVQAYNNFEVEKMLTYLHDEIVFKNISNGEITLELKGLEAFRSQAKLAASFFTEREQRITSFVCNKNVFEIEIDYYANLATDLPNGLKKGDKINLKGKSVFCFADGKIIEIQDIS